MVDVALYTFLVYLCNENNSLKHFTNKSTNKNEKINHQKAINF